MAWGGSGKFLFDNASIELGYIPIEFIQATPTADAFAKNFPLVVNVGTLMIRR